MNNIRYGEKVKRAKPKVKYVSLSIPAPFIEEIKQYIQEKPEYQSVAEFAKQTMREKMQGLTDGSSKDIKGILNETKRSTATINEIEKILAEMGNRWRTSAEKLEKKGYVALDLTPGEKKLLEEECKKRNITVDELSAQILQDFLDTKK